MTTQTVGLAPQTVRPWRPFRTRVKALRRLTPSFLRITFAGDALHDFADNGYDQRFKLVFPAAACGFTKFPDTDRWYSDLRALPEAEQCRVRTYTVRQVRAELGEVDVDMVIHEPHGDQPAPALRWALNAAVGDELIMVGPDARHDGPHGGVDFAAPEHAELLIAGDETAAPAIAAILERLPITARGTVLIEVPDAADALVLDTPPDVEVRWLARGGGDWGSELIPAVTETAAGLRIAPTLDEVDEVDVDAEILWDLPGSTAHGECYVWIAAEAGVVKTLRRVLRQDLGLPRECGAFMGYWRDGRDAD